MSTDVNLWCCIGAVGLHLAGRGMVRDQISAYNEARQTPLHIASLLGMHRVLCHCLSYMLDHMLFGRHGRGGGCID